MFCITEWGMRFDIKLKYKFETVACPLISCAAATAQVEFPPSWKYHHTNFEDFVNVNVFEPDPTATSHMNCGSETFQTVEVGVCFSSSDNLASAPPPPPLKVTVCLQFNKVRVSIFISWIYCCVMLVFGCCCWFCLVIGSWHKSIKHTTKCVRKL